MNETSILNTSAADQKPGFLRRQFAATATGPQMLFDAVVGIVLPILCLIFDPFVFRSGGAFGGGLLKSLQVFAYIVIGLEVLTLGLWLASGERIRAWSRAVAGILLTGALFSFIIALVLLPFSLMGLIFYFIGALGFTPFLTAFIYLRNGQRALRVAGANANGSATVATLMLGTVFVLGGPALVQWKISQTVRESVQELTTGGTHQQAAAATRLKLMYRILVVDLDVLVWAYAGSTDQAQKRATGENLQGAYGSGHRV